MNQSCLTTAHIKRQQQAYDLLIRGDYLQATSLYEQAIAAEPDVKSYHWYLGLILLLQGQEVEAQTTWFMAMVEGDTEQVGCWNIELVNVLQTEAVRQEEKEEYAVVGKIRHYIKEISPKEIDNLLHLVQLSIKLETYTGEYLQELTVIEILKSELRAEANLELLIQTLQQVLNYAPLHPSSLDLLEACLPQFKENTQALLNILLPAAVDIAYSQRQPGIAAKLAELYLRLDPKNTEFIGHLAIFYQNASEYDLGIETAKLFYSLVDDLPTKILANSHILRGLMSAGGYWEESCLVHQRQQNLVALLIEQNLEELTLITVVRLINAYYYAFYIEDNPQKNRIIQNKLLQLCESNIVNYSRQQFDRYHQENIDKKRQKLSTKKLKIGYISHCLRAHSVGWLARWLFQHHDIDKFQINGYFIATSTFSDPLHEWYVSQVAQAYKSNNISALAEQIYQDEIDILIDLDSITLDTTAGVLALKPAPIQVTWLGWDASGSPSVDYFIADPYVLPDSAQEYYREKIWRLPQTYIAVDGFEVSVPTIRRDTLDIESDAVVYLCGQRGFKRHPDITRLQLRIIKEVPNSYFLIKGAADQESIKNFFTQLAEEEGVDCSKLRFLRGAPTEAVHRANLSIADVVLDTYPYNGATTTLETLWMCIPLVTRVGEQFAARNSYTMMMNAGITEGIAWTDEEYVEWGVRLGKDKALRDKIACQLKASRQTAPLWNAKQFTLEMEKAYEQMWQQYICS